MHEILIAIASLVLRCTEAIRCLPTHPIHSGFIIPWQHITYTQEEYILP